MDVGTTALKAIVLTPAGVAVAVAERAYRVGTVLGGGANLSGAVEQDPDDWLEAFALALRDLGYAADADPADALPPQPPSPSADRCRTSVSSATVEAFAPRYSTRTSAPPPRRRRAAACRPDDVDARLANFKGPAACLAGYGWRDTNRTRCARRIVCSSARTPSWRTR